MSVTLDDEKFLIRALSEDVGVSVGIPGTDSERRRLIRSLMNIRGPMPASDDVLEVQDRYLSGLLEEKGVVDADGFEFDDGICVWQGDRRRDIHPRHQRDSRADEQFRAGGHYPA